MGEAIKIHKAILHILDINHDYPIVSVEELELENEIYSFLEKHLLRLISDDGLKNAYFNKADNTTYELCKKISEDQRGFENLSIDLANNLFNIMKEHPAIPSADIIFCIYSIDEIQYMAMLK